MSNHASAEEDLRVIRGLMERATVYRAISAPTALVGGVLSLISTIFIYLSATGRTPLGRAVGPREFAFIWIDVLALTIVANTFFIWREAHNGGRPFVSSGMKLALRAIAPNLLVPAIFTIWFLRVGFLGAVEAELVTVWVIFYGLALLSTMVFAPRSLIILGWAVLLTGIAVPVISSVIEGFSGDVSNLIMGLTFGVYHLIYSAATWTRAEPVHLGDAIGE